jgi:hypothetical protein
VPTLTFVCLELADVELAKSRRALHNPAVTDWEFADISMPKLTGIIAIATRTGKFCGSANVVDDTTNRIRVLNERGDTVAVEHEKTEGRKDDKPACDQRYLWDKRSMGILMGDQKT